MLDITGFKVSKNVGIIKSFSLEVTSLNFKGLASAEGKLLKSNAYAAGSGVLSMKCEPFSRNAGNAVIGVGNVTPAANSSFLFLAVLLRPFLPPWKETFEFSLNVSRMVPSENQNISGRSN